MLEYFLLEGGKVPTISRYNEDEDTEVCRKGSNMAFCKPRGRVCLETRKREKDVE